MAEGEVQALVTSLHLWDTYVDMHSTVATSSADRDDSNNNADLTQIGTDGQEHLSVLDTFWSVRKGLCDEDANGRGTGYVGIIAQIKAILGLGPDDFDGAIVLTSQLPVVVVQSTENVFVNPRSASVYQPDQLPPERYLVPTVADALLPGTLPTLFPTPPSLMYPPLSQSTTPIYKSTLTDP